MERIHIGQMKQYKLILMSQATAEDMNALLAKKKGEIEEVDLIPGKVFTFLEQITNLTRNTNCYLLILRIIDIILA